MAAKTAAILISRVRLSHPQSIRPIAAAASWRMSGDTGE
jgi:hypothetical protein